VFLAPMSSDENDRDLLMFNSDPRTLAARGRAERLQSQLDPRRRHMQRSFEPLPPALPREVPDYHQRQASHCRALAASTCSVMLKAHLLREAEEHEKIAEKPGEAWR
ncbi:MAG: hypothetical protein AB7H71_07100, partial [Alphaproteobacteria bacterium]